jgi:hypothetical protein
MAEKLSDSAEEKRLELLREIEEANQRIEEQNKKAAIVGAEERKRLEKRIEREKEKLKELQKQVKPLEEQNTLAEEYNDLQDTLQSSFTKLDIGARKLITTNKIGGSAFASLATDILNIKDEQAGLSEDELKNNQKKLDVYTSLYTSIIEQADAASDVKNQLLGQSEVDNRRLKFEESIANLGPQEKEKLRDLFKLKENLIQQEERLKAIQTEADDLYQKLPSFLQDGVDMAKKLGKSLSEGMLPIAILGALLAAAIVSFTELEEAAGKFREETGLTKSQTKDISNQVRQIRAEFAGLGIEAKDVYDSVAALKAEFSDSTQLTKAVIANVTLLNKQFAISQKDAAAVNMVFQSMAGLSAQTAQGVAQQVAEMANLAGVAPSKVFNDIAESAEATFTYFKGDVNLIAKQAIEARRLGTTLKDVLKTTEDLLDFENGIEKELVAATFVGGQFNLSQARALAYAGKNVEAQKEILRQVERNGKFADQDMFTKKALADAAGMTVDQLSKQLLIQQRLGNLSEDEKKRVADAMDKGLDITNMTDAQLAAKTQQLTKEQEIADKVTQMENSFKGIVASLGEGLLPLMEGLAPLVTMIATAFGYVFKVLNYIPGVFPAIVAGLTAMWLMTMKVAVAAKMAAIAKVYSAYGAMPFIGVALAVGVIAAMVSAMSNAKNVGDMAIGAGGKGVQISTAEGGIFKPSPNDQIAVAPNAVDSLKNLDYASKYGKMSMMPIAGGMGTSAAIDILVNEMKALRQDMNAGKIGVYMDGAKVTSGIAVSSEKSTRNNFNYGQRT